VNYTITTESLTLHYTFKCTGHV